MTYTVFPVLTKSCPSSGCCAEWKSEMLTSSKKAMGSEGVRASSVRSVIVASDGSVQPAPLALLGAKRSAYGLNPSNEFKAPSGP